MTADCYVFPLSSVDLILGVLWLEELEDVQINWRYMTMSFISGGSWITLSGDSSLCHTPLSAQVIHKIKDVSGVPLLWQMDSVKFGSNPTHPKS